MMWNSLWNAFVHLRALDEAAHVAERRPVKGRLWIPATSELTI